jgi:YhcH/YjgK/YiaL family protein
MILDHLRNARLYTGLGPGLTAALAFLERPDLATLPAGRLELDGDRVYAMVNDYTTKPAAEAKWEAHRKYTDVQFLVSGRERVGVAYTPALEHAAPYDETRDFLLLTGKGSTLALVPGFFLVLGPDDAHQPGMAWGKPAPVRKIVVKVAVGA